MYGQILNAQGYYQENYRESNHIEWVQCIQDEQHYCKSECVFDKDGGVYIHASNLKAFLEDIKSTITDKEYKAIRTNLYNQLNSK